MDHTIALIRRAHEGDENARAQLVEENTGLIWCVVKRFYGRGTEAEDLFQIGSIGLLKAIDKFDLGYDVKFSTYAVPMITGEIKRFLRDDGMLKVSRSLKGGAHGKAWKRTAVGRNCGRNGCGKRRAGDGDGGSRRSGIASQTGRYERWK